MEPKLPSLEERQEWDYNQKEREIKIARMRAHVLRKQITEAYEILERIRFDFLGDTAFRDCISIAKSGLEKAVGDFLLDDSYHKKSLDKHRSITPQQFFDEKQRHSTPVSSTEN